MCVCILCRVHERNANLFNVYILLRNKPCRSKRPCSSPSPLTGCRTVSNAVKTSFSRTIYTEFSPDKYLMTSLSVCTYKRFYRRFIFSLVFFSRLTYYVFTRRIPIVADTRVSFNFLEFRFSPLYS